MGDRDRRDADRRHGGGHVRIAFFDFVATSTAWAPIAIYVVLEGILLMIGLNLTGAPVWPDRGRA